MLNTNYFDAITKLYTTYFNRPADVIGHEYWQTVAVNNGGNLNAIADTFAQSQEFLNHYSGLNSAAIVNRTYEYFFAHGPDAGGLNFWTAALDEGRVTLGNVVKEIANSAQGQDYRTLELKNWASARFTWEVDHYEQQFGGLFAGAVEIDAARDWLNVIYDENSYVHFTTNPRLRDVVLEIMYLEELGPSTKSQDIAMSFEHLESVVNSSYFLSDFDNQVESSSEIAVDSAVPHTEVEIVGTAEFAWPMV